jgi:hypothetical protein
VGAKRRRGQSRRALEQRSSRDRGLLWLHVDGMRGLIRRTLPVHAVPPPVDSASSARLPCRVLRQLPCNTPLSRARIDASRIDHASVLTSYRRCQILECLE